MRRKALENNSVEKKVVVKTPRKTVISLASSSASSATPSLVPVVHSESILKTNKLYFNVPEEKCFVLCDGKKIHSCKELADILPVMSDDMFSYHVTDTKNDFSNWINDVLEQSDLAQNIHSIKNKTNMSIELYKHMFEVLEKSISKN